MKVCEFQIGHKHILAGDVPMRVRQSGETSGKREPFRPTLIQLCQSMVESGGGGEWIFTEGNGGS